VGLIETDATALATAVSFALAGLGDAYMALQAESRGSERGWRGRVVSEMVSASFGNASSIGLQAPDSPGHTACGRCRGTKGRVPSDDPGTSSCQ
jgi:hypothetical protein